MAYTDYAATMIEADKPVTTLLMGYIRDNTRHLKDRLTTGTGHTHNQAGTDEGGAVVPADGSVSTIKIADANVTLAKLKMTRGSYGAASGGSHYIAVPLYAHTPTAQKTGSTYNMQLALQSRSGPSWAATETAEVTAILDASSTDQFYVYWDYHVN